MKTFFKRSIAFRLSSLRQEPPSGSSFVCFLICTVSLLCACTNTVTEMPERLTPDQEITKRFKQSQSKYYDLVTELLIEETPLFLYRDSQEPNQTKLPKYSLYNQQMHELGIFSIVAEDELITFTVDEKGNSAKNLIWQPHRFSACTTENSDREPKYNNFSKISDDWGLAYIANRLEKSPGQSTAEQEKEKSPSPRLSFFYPAPPRHLLV